jgi:hypothetical protein
MSRSRAFFSHKEGKTKEEKKKMNKKKERHE